MLKKLSLALLLVTRLQSYEIAVITDSGEQFFFDVHPDESFVSVTEHIGNFLAAEREAPPPPPSNAPNYYTPASPEDKENIGYIISTLGGKHFAKVPFYKGSLESAGDKIRHVHPLRQLHTIFTDERLKVHMHNLKNQRERGLFWKTYRKEMGESLRTEANKGVLKKEHVESFAKDVDIDPNLITPLSDQGKWEEFLDTLVDKVPRKGEPGRYDM